MKIFKMVRGVFIKRNRSSKIMQNVIFRVKLRYLTLRKLLIRLKNNYGDPESLSFLELTQKLCTQFAKTTGLELA